MIVTPLKRETATNISLKGLATSIVQCNKMNGKIKTNNEYCKEILEDIIKFLKNKDYYNLIISAD